MRNGDENKSHEKELREEAIIESGIEVGKREVVEKPPDRQQVVLQPYILLWSLNFYLTMPLLAVDGRIPTPGESRMHMASKRNGATGKKAPNNLNKAKQLDAVRP